MYKFAWFSAILLIFTFKVVAPENVTEKINTALEIIKNAVIEYIDILSDFKTNKILSATEAVQEAMLEDYLTKNLSPIAKRFDKLQTAAAENKVNIENCIIDIKLNFIDIVDDALEVLNSCTERYREALEQLEKAMVQKMMNYVTDATNAASKIDFCDGNTFCEQAVLSQLLILQKGLQSKVEQKAYIFSKGQSLKRDEFVECVQTGVKSKIDFLDNSAAVAEYCYRLLM